MKAIVKTTYVFVIIVVCNYYNYAQDLNALKWNYWGALQSPRYGFCVQTLSHHQIMVCGGLTTPRNIAANDRVDKVVSDCEVIDIETGKVEVIASMHYQHAYFSSLLTPDSNVVVISGITGTGGWKLTSICEMYDRKSKKWIVLGSLKQARWRSSAAWINDTEFIIVGGMDENEASRQTAELFNIKTGSSKLIANFPIPSNNGIAITTVGGEALFFAGRAGGSGSNQSKNVMRYNRLTDDWEVVGTIPKETTDPALVKLDNGKHIFMGGYHENPRGTVNVIGYEVNNSFVEIGKLIEPRHLLSAAQITDSNVVVISGLNPPQKPFISTEIVNVYTGKTVFGPNLKNGRIRYCSGSLINPKKQFLKRKAFAIGGITQADSATSIIEVLEIDTALIVNPPTIVSERIDCGSYILELSDNSKISNVILDNQFTHNCYFKLSSSLPSKKIIVTISLEDNSRSGKFKLRVENNGGKVLFIENTIKPSAPIELILDKMYRPIFRDSIPIGTLHCTVFPLINKSDDTVNVENMYMAQNTYFSIPETSKTKYLLPKDTMNVKVCYTTHTSYESIIDTLVIGEDCNEIKHPFVVRGLSLYENDNNKCKIPLSITQYKSKQPGMPNVFYGDDYVTITVKDSPMIREVYISNIFGTLISSHYQVSSLQNRADVTIDTSMYQTGVYYVVISSDEITQTVPILLTH